MHGYVSSSLAEARLLLLHSSLYAVRCASTILSVTPHLSILEKKIRSASQVDTNCNEVLFPKAQFRRRTLPHEPNLTRIKADPNYLGRLN